MKAFYTRLKQNAAEDNPRRTPILSINRIHIEISFKGSCLVQWGPTTSIKGNFAQPISQFFTQLSNPLMLLGEKNR